MTRKERKNDFLSQTYMDQSPNDRSKLPGKYFHDTATKCELRAFIQEVYKYMICRNYASVFLLDILETSVNNKKIFIIPALLELRPY